MFSFLDDNIKEVIIELDRNDALFLFFGMAASKHELDS